MKRIHVAVAVILNEHKQILIAKRHAHMHQGGKWEFPGGKVEQKETTEQALSREINEEINIYINGSTPLMTISHDYSDKQVLLDIHTVTDFTGTPEGREGQLIQWVSVDALASIDFPDANQPIVAKLEQLLS
ncbi:8-oxo-dGTP diphosphatase MutT [Shewanella sp. Scap07]|uniref:8-oxo-dGTP diphosphatase MutT n=1 Tax=Shewanella sp. Scap07 TaxID=2589987 RepID=UPI0015BC3618|nr:8-oxo-dGTP diphosphatase MutT [Shewanella sp. Scap07]QLE87214.1 8-oxo-dGTP diphosphatase MutT [Shewanella sp. Scap07]